MAKTKKTKEKKVRRPKVLVIFDILIAVMIVVAIAIPCLAFSPVGSTIKEWMKSWGTGFTDFMRRIVDWFAVHIERNFHFFVELSNHGRAFNTMLNCLFLLAIFLVGFVMTYIPFVVMYKNWKAGKKEKYRTALCWIAAIFNFGFYLAFFSLFGRYRLENALGGFYSWYPKLYDWAVSMFRPDGMFASLRLTFLTASPAVNAIFYMMLADALIVAILLFISVVIKKRVVAKDAKAVETVADEVKDDVKEVEAVPAPAIVAAVEENSVEAAKDDARIEPTVREVKILDSLEAIHPAELEEIPGAGEGDAEVDHLTPAETTLETDEQDQKNLDALEKEEKPVRVLPGIDEFDADPWNDKKEEPVVEEKGEEVIKPEPSEPAVITTSVEEPIVIADNENKGDERLQEMTQEIVVEEKTDRSEFKDVTTNNEHEEVATPVAPVDNTWKLPKYVEEEKNESVAAPTPVVPAPAGRKERPKIVPVAPIVREEVKEEVQEEKKLAPITGPLHSTERSTHEKIEKVEAKKVRFELRNYQIKTYKGDLTAEEAFAKGVTKVQPSVNPVFANQGSEPAWKQKRRIEEIRKNGYGDVTQVKDLSKKAEKPAKPVQVKGSSIRDLLKNKKSAEAQAAIEPVEEKKPAVKKPITPIQIVKPLEEEKPVEEKKEANPLEVDTSNFHPIAPIQKPNKPRPNIKPIDPAQNRFKK